MIRLRLSDARGFAMIEAIAAATLLVIVALGVLRGLDVANRSSGREKARSTAAALTEQDQERLRSFRAVDLANYERDRGHHRQQGEVHDHVAGRLGSRLDRRHRELQQQRDAGRLHADHVDDDVAARSTPRSRRSRCPASSLRPIGAFGTNQGTLGIQVNNADGAGVEGMPVTIAGPVQPDQPDQLGGLRDLRLRADRLATPPASPAPAGSTRAATRLATVGATVSQGTVNVKTLIYDQAASVDATFDTEDRSATRP